VIDGVFVVDKPGGATSHDLVARLRKQLGMRGVGHAGTLDPMATGVLLLLAGEATKLSPYLTLEHKTYLAEVRFGRATDTDDVEGHVVRESPLPAGGLDENAVSAALTAERERTLQLPPAVSAIQIGGERAYRLVRRGETPVLPPRSVRVLRLELRALGSDRLEVEVTASKGYYVRALARDLGERLGLAACLGALRRLESGGFSLAEAHPWPLAAGAVPLSLSEAARRCLPAAELTPNGARRAKLGQAVAPEDFELAPSPEVPSAWFEHGELVAVGMLRDDAYRVLRGFGPR
jgi:tRNA pseudouridine55 synthase